MRLYTEMLQLNKQALTAGEKQTRVIAQQIQARQKEYQALSATVKLQAEGDTRAIKAREAYNREVAKQEDKAQTKSDKAEQTALKNSLKSEEARMAQLRAAAEQQTRLIDNVTSRLVLAVGRFALNTLKSQWEAAISYVTEYSNALNEIQTITMKSDAQAEQMGENFRRIAKELSVSSKEVAEAAVTFYRQGLDDSEVNQRLEWVTKYAKLSHLAFDEAAELVTAATNSMAGDIQGDIQRVVDVFLYLGDSAATSGEEIGRAMQKASASATQFGLSFEWLGSYIAAVSEQTRQAPESIGNAFNTMMARMHSIKQNGFNEEDATKINDVAKALRSIDVQLMDGENNWRNMSDIYADIAEKWDELDGKQKSYIATTMAGTRQQNVFFALMNDMAKGVENGSRAWELYTGAMDAAGTASAKYAIWQESIAASQGRLQASLETLYASLMNSDVIGGFYEVLTWIVGGLNELGGYVPVLAGVCMAFFTTVFVQATTAAGGVAVLGGAFGVLGAMVSTVTRAFSTNPILMFATVLLALIPVIGAVGQGLGLLETQQERYEKAQARLQDAQAKLAETAEMQGLVDRFQELTSQTELTAAEQAELNSIMDTLSATSLNAKSAIEQFQSGQKSAAETVQALNKDLETEIELLQAQARLASQDMLRNTAAKPMSVANRKQLTGNNRTFSIEELETVKRLQAQYFPEEEANWENFMRQADTLLANAGWEYNGHKWQTSGLYNTLYV